MATERVAILVAALAVAFVPNTGRGQANVDVLNPNLSGFKVDASARWSVNGGYEYSYVLTNGPGSTGALLVFQLDVSKPFTAGPNLPNSGAGRIFNLGTSPDVPPVGLIVPALWNGTVTPVGGATWGIDARLATGQLDITQMAPGKVSPSMGLRSHDPPGLRSFGGGTTTQTDRLTWDAP